MRSLNFYNKLRLLFSKKIYVNFVNRIQLFVKLFTQ